MIKLVVGPADLRPGRARDPRCPRCGADSWEHVFRGAQGRRPHGHLKSGARCRSCGLVRGAWHLERDRAAP